MLDPVLVALFQNILEMVGEVGDVRLSTEGRALLGKIAGLVEFRFRGQPGRELRFIMAACVFVELLLHLAAGCLLAEHFDQQLNDLRLVAHRPGYRRLFQEDVYKRQFYTMFNMQPVGKYVLEVCVTGPCMVCLLYTSRCV